MNRTLRLALAVLFTSSAVDAASAATPPDETAIARQQEAYWAMSREAPSGEPLIELLRRGDYVALEKELEAVQRGYEANEVPELHVFSLFHFFTKEGHEGAIKKWIAARPDSWTARAARGLSHAGHGARSRGGKSVGETLPQQFEQMQRSFALATSEFQAVLAVKPRFLPAYARLLDIARMRGDCEAARAVADEALREDPGTFFVRDSYMGLLNPKWCGSWEAMESFAQNAQAHVKRNPHLVVLLGYPVAGRAYELVLAKDWPGARDLYTQALRYGREPIWLSMRAMASEKLGECPAAITDLDEAIRFDPKRSEYFMQRARCAGAAAMHDGSLGN